MAIGPLVPKEEKIRNEFLFCYVKCLENERLSRVCKNKREKITSKQGRK